jgi:hypothetical protein
VNDDVACEIVTLSNGVNDLDPPALGARNIEAAELLLADSGAVVASGVVVGVDVRSSVAGRKTGGHVDPALVVVHAEGDDEDLAAGLEAEDAGGAAAAHGEVLLAVDDGPGAAISVVPDGLFDDLEIGVGVGLVDAGSDGVRHGV